MQTTQQSKPNQEFYHFLRKSYQRLQSNHDYLKIIKQIEYEFNTIFSERDHSHVRDQILKLRNELLPWIIDFPKSNLNMLVNELKINHPAFTHIEKIIGSNEIQYFISMQVAEVTPHLINIFGLSLQILNNKNLESSNTDPSDHIVWKEQLIRDFYYPIILHHFEKSYIARMNNHYYDLDRAIEKAPKDLHQLTKDLNNIKNELNHYIIINDAIKLRWELSQALYDLVEDFTTAIGSQNFSLGLEVIDHFRTMWVADCNRLGGLYPIVEAYIGSVMSCLSIYGLAVQLAWYTYYSQDFTPLSMTLLSISIGIKLSEYNSFGIFKNPTNRKRPTSRRKRKVLSN